LEINLKRRNLHLEFKHKALRSSGPGGQNVNKLNSKVELRFNIQESILLTVNEKVQLLKKLSNRINSLGELIVVSQTERTQLKNKQAAIERCYNLLNRALKQRKKRYKTKPTKASKLKRLKLKKERSEIKHQRRHIY